MDGTYTKHTYGDWVAYEWTDDGSVTAQDIGLVDALVIGAGGSSSGSYAGTAGCLIHGVDGLVSGSTAIIVGQRLTGGTKTIPGRSALGDISSGGGNSLGLERKYEYTATVGQYLSGLLMAL